MQLCQCRLSGGPEGRVWDCHFYCQCSLRCLVRHETALLFNQAFGQGVWQWRRVYLLAKCLWLEAFLCKQVQPTFMQFSLLYYFNRECRRMTCRRQSCFSQTQPNANVAWRLPGPGQQESVVLYGPLSYSLHHISNTGVLHNQIAFFPLSKKEGSSYSFVRQCTNIMTKAILWVGKHTFCSCLFPCS